MTMQKLLRVVLILRGSVEEDRLLLEPRPVTLGPRADAFLLTPPLLLPEGTPLIEPGPQGYTLALAPGMTGTLTVGGTEMPVPQAFATRAAPAGGTGVRTLRLGEADQGVVGLDESGDLAVLFQFVTPAERVPRHVRPDPFLWQALLLALILVGGTVGVSYVFAPATLVSELEIKPERMARLIVKKPPEEVEKKVTPDEAALARKLLEPPRPLPLVPRTRAPVTERERLEQRVAKRGVLLAMDQLTRGDNAVRNLFARDTAGELSRSLDALVDDARARAQAEAGGAGGPGESTRGSSMGGGGTGGSIGQTYGGGRIDTGGAGGVQTRLAGAKERKVSVSVAPGDPTVDGGLSKDIIHRVVRAHQAGIKYCYETELVRLPKLAGKIVVMWRIDLEGKVVQPRLRTTTMNNPAVEACLVRQISRWQFPKPKDTMVEVNYPFLFRSGL
jgi:hypothetical protein